ncbi:hypothetical protein ABEB36_000123 [Hypothenemus hampei]|uniref:Uncharacterized protein n=1 Tax=Hypothenemus hampei TaxID=57062 RepID=A0ABD1FCX3_HYPHA
MFGLEDRSSGRKNSPGRRSVVPEHDPVISGNLERREANGFPGLKQCTEKGAARPESPKEKLPVAESMSRRLLMSTRRPWWLRTSAPINAWGTAAMQKCHLMGRLRPKSSSR